MATRKGVIPQLDRGTPAYNAREKRRAQFERFCKNAGWTRADQLQALSAVVFHAAKDDCVFAISWLEELLEDIRTKHGMGRN